MKLDLATIPKFELYQDDSGSFGVRDGGLAIFPLSEPRARMIAAAGPMLRLLLSCYRRNRPLVPDLETLFRNCGLEVDYHE